ncbi:MAG: choice-of-anchor L domain-containing protein [Flavobacteriales bacterium]|nr:choice-of-anchor L domain-containing protein [Flavobacteriales bacterium]
MQSQSRAQLVVNNNLTPLQLANQIVGVGFDVMNVVLNCPNGAVGYFDATATPMAIPNGILFTTGSTQTAVGPNNSVSAGVNNGTAGDNQLDVLANTPTYDACVLEFDLIPYCDTLRINYAFASEEYPEFVGREFNDVFAFYVSGPGIVGAQNIALVPGTTLPVSINNINQNVNSQFYYNNQGGTAIQYDAFTWPLVGKIAVIPCETYHLKIGIADVEDGIFDSGIFIQSNSVQCVPFVFNEVGANQNGVEGCTPGAFTFCRTGEMNMPLTVHYEIGGTATNGVDYQTIPDSVVIPANQSCVEVQIIPNADNDEELNEFVQIVYQRGSCPVYDTINIEIDDPAVIDAGPDVNVCSGDIVQIGNVLDPSYTYSWSPTTGLTTPNSSTSNLVLAVAGTNPVSFTYILTATSPDGCVLTDSLDVSVNPPPDADFSFQTGCTNLPTTFQDVSTSMGGNISKWLWDFGDNFFDTVPDPEHSYNRAGTYTVTLTVTDEFGCTGSTTQTLQIWSLPVANFTVNEPCEGDTSFFINQTTLADPSDAIGVSDWDFGDASPHGTAQNPNHIYKTSGTYFVTLNISSVNGCPGSITKAVIIQPKPTAQLLVTDICQNETAVMYNRSIGLTGGTWVWDFGDGTTSDTLNPNHQYANDGDYTVKLHVSSFYGCEDSTEAQITVFPMPEPRFFLDSIAGCAPLCIVFNDATDEGQATIDQWGWIFGNHVEAGKDVTYCFDEDGSFSPGLMIVTDDGCSDTVFRQNLITVYPQPDAGISITPPVVDDINPVVYITDESNGGTLWIWDYGDGEVDTTTTNPNPIRTYDEPGTYTITQTVVNDYGCMDTARKYVVVRELSTVYIPNAFTPQGDGINEGFIPKATGIFAEADFKMYILDRWGNTIYESHSLNDPWDGKVYGPGNKIVQNDVYVYICRFFKKDNGELLREMVGSVTVIR